jgi:hypothetical protein
MENRNFQAIWISRRTKRAFVRPAARGGTIKTASTANFPGNGVSANHSPIGRMDKELMTDLDLDRWHNYPPPTEFTQGIIRELIDALRATRQALALMTKGRDAYYDRCNAANKRIAELEQQLALANTEARNWKTAAEANRDAAMGYQDRALGAEQQSQRDRDTLDAIAKAFLEKYYDGFTYVPGTLADEITARLKRDRERIAELTGVLEWLDRLGGLGLDKHERIRAALAKEPMK